MKHQKVETLNKKSLKKDILEVIRLRRSVFPRDYTDQEIPRETLLELLEAAHAAPTHKRTQPWNFVVFRNHGKERLADALVAMYKRTTPPDRYLAKKEEDLRQKALRSAAVVMIYVRYSGAVPPWEEVAATAAAVQNLWLAASAQGIGAYWSSPGLISAASEHFDLAANEECLGFFYMGHHHLPDQSPLNRVPLEERVRWEEEDHDEEEEDKE